MDLNDKHVVITGPTSGIGRSAARDLARRGAQLTLLSRNSDKANALAEDIVADGGLAPNPVQMDMSRLASVRAAAATVLAGGRPVDILLNNAGVINTKRLETEDGFEETLAVNHFAPFLLTGLLLPAILEAAPGARIVNVASDAHSFVKGMDFDDMQARKRYKTFQVYGRSKLANILFTRSLAARLQDRGVTVNCLHPGAVSTDIGKQNGGVTAEIIHWLLKPFFRSADKGAETSIYLCTSDEVAAVSGAYFQDCKRIAPKPWAEDDSAAQRLWDYTEECTGFRYPD